MPLPIEEYGLIGDCQTAALVGRDGSIDWLCLPRFDSAACFAALLGKPEHGRWKIAPAGKIKKVTRRYRPGTLILETEFVTAAGTVCITDFMPVRDDGGVLDLIRIVTGKAGKVKMDLELIIRFDYGSVVPWVQKSKHGITAIAGPDKLRILSDVPLHGKDLTTVADFTVAEGEKIRFDLTWFPSHAKEPEAKQPGDALQETERWWLDWSGRCGYHGEWRDEVVRSLITLKALTYEPTGGMVAAPTTSLPEKLGGERNWDYRYCWLRDSTFTLLAFLNAGYVEEARAWREWLLRAVAGSPSETSILYGLRGERRLTELELGWLPGYEGSRPVRTGNAAYKQFQLDVYGEVSDTLYQCRRSGLEASAASWRLEKDLLNFLEGAWQKPDEGIWEVRGKSRHFTHSKVMAWVAFDRAVKSATHFGLNGPVAKWRRQGHAIHEEVCRRGFSAKLNAFTQFYGSENLDASLLMIPLVGFLPANDSRVLGTVKAIAKHLLTPEGFVRRYLPHQEIDGLPHGEAAFLPCTFWLADNYAMQGGHAVQEARRILERLLKISNDVGLLSEEYDWQQKRLVGNFPQALSHIGLISTVHNLSGRRHPAKQRDGEASA